MMFGNLGSLAGGHDTVQCNPGPDERRVHAKHTDTRPDKLNISLLPKFLSSRDIV